ncbi:hypothetical protein [Streptomyces tsukubensis]|uniref:hypothetical protein n=1 Tax=Streptomyces tsukubensis TaxID=83656 RepID=UPI00344CFD60
MTVLAHEARDTAGAVGTGGEDAGTPTAVPHLPWPGGEPVDRGGAGGITGVDTGVPDRLPAADDRAGSGRAGDHVVSGQRRPGGGTGTEERAKEAAGAAGTSRVPHRAPGGAPPPGVVRLWFADGYALERAAGAFGARRDTAPGAGPGAGLSDAVALTLTFACGTGVGAVRAVLDVLDAAGVTAESITVHAHTLDDVFATVTGLV